ncbi:MAG: hypothetical protein K0Q56_1009 [Sporolactobacillus laevolacticus]|jgi:hypothetical protein|nr:hypothetical protein [Sporolactobacillus laevolacticus]
MMPPFDRGPQQPFFWNPPVQSSQRPTPPTRGFPPIFPSMAPPPSQAPIPPSSATGGLGGLSGLISSFLSPGTAGGSGGGMNLFGMLMNAQKAIQTAQTVLPMIQQFGPLIKNAPAIISVLKGMQEDSATEDSENEDKKDEEQNGDTESPVEPKNQNTSSESHHAAAQTEKKKTTITQKVKKKPALQKKASLLNSETLPTKPSVPRMYI